MGSKNKKLQVESVDNSVTQNSSVRLPYMDALLITLATAWVYVIAVAYESGYARWYGYPHGLISVNVVTLVSSALSLLATFFLLFVASEAWNQQSVARTALGREIRALVFLEFSIAFIVFLLALGWGEFFFLSSIIGLIAIKRLVVPYLATSLGKTYEERLLVVEKANHATWKNSFFGILANRIGITIYRRVAAVILSVILAFAIAYGAAKQEAHYFVLADATNMVVLRIHGSTIITSEYDPCSKEIIGPFIVQTANPDAPLKIIKARIGPLIPRRAIGAQETSVSFRGVDLKISY